MMSDTKPLSRLFSNAPDTVGFRRLRKRLARQAEEAINRYGMTAGEAQPRWLVCLSGGKDSYALLTVLLDLIAQGRLSADLVACNLDQGQPGFPKHVLPDYLETLDIKFRIETKDTYSTVIEKTPEGATLCSLCSRLRRGHLYRVAREEGCSAIVLGHHRDDVLETFFLNLFFGGRLEAMPPKLLNDEGDLLTLRPLALAGEEDIAQFARAMAYPIIPCTLCGSQDGLQRQHVKEMLSRWEERHPGRKETIFRALSTTRPGHLLDPELFDFIGLRPVGHNADH
ncbi:tRNA 2-thiocytidine(32) synthetase TtcA [Parvularcula marina]|uniref:tRNA 2-thiocytidine(32) synthetase TtcA n=1 Tax=Parvularcula marina TaxID=2292771 RepID=UPI00351480D2